MKRKTNFIQAEEPVSKLISLKERAAIRAKERRTVLPPNRAAGAPGLVLPFESGTTIPPLISMNKLGKVLSANEPALVILNHLGLEPGDRFPHRLYRGINQALKNSGPSWVDISLDGEVFRFYVSLIKNTGIINLLGEKKEESKTLSGATPVTEYIEILRQNGIKPEADIEPSVNESLLSPVMRVLKNDSRETDGSLAGVSGKLAAFSLGKVVVPSLEYLEFSLTDVVKMTLAPIREAAVSKGLKFQISLDKKIPHCLLGDPVRVGQILTNLSENAVKFTSDGQICLQVGLEEETNNEVILRFRLEDTGCGLDEEMLEKIRSGSLNDLTNQGFPCLGLRTCLDLINRMGGHLIAVPNSGGGLVLLWELAFPKFQLNENRMIPHGSRFLRDTRIALASLSSADGLLAEDQLKQWNADTRLAEHLNDLLLNIQSEHYDCVVLFDSGKSGAIFSIIAQIREVYEQDELPVIVVATNASQRIQNQLQSAGANIVVSETPWPEPLFYALYPFSACYGMPFSEKVQWMLAEQSEQMGAKTRFLFAEYLPELLDILEEQVKSRDWEAISKTVRQLKANLLLVALHSVVPILDRMDNLAQNQSGRFELTWLVQTVRKTVAHHFALPGDNATKKLRA